MQRRITMLGIVLGACSIANAQMPVWDKLMTRAQMEGERTRTRAIALNMACDWADAAGADQNVSLVSSWAVNIEQSANQLDPLPEAELAARRELICSLVCQSGSRLNAIADPAVTFDLWALAATQSWVGQGIKEAVFERIADNPSGSGARHEAALVALRDSGVGLAGRLPAAFVGLIDATAIPALRAMVSESGFDPATFNFTAAAVLAEASDTAILPEFQARQETFSAAGARYGSALAWYTWQIQAQNPPSQLLEHIASAELHSPQSRRWAIRRAVELGLPVSDIRQAILQYAAVGHPVGPGHLAVGIKALAISLGVLTAEDLPNVTMEGAHAMSDPEWSPHAPWEVATPVVEWQPPWEPRYENYEVFFDWMQTISWESLPEEQATELFYQKLCELELVPPAQCAAAP